MVIIRDKLYSKKKTTMHKNIQKELDNSSLYNVSCKGHAFISDLLFIGSFQTVINEGFSITFIKTNKTIQLFSMEKLTN